MTSFPTVSRSDYRQGRAVPVRARSQASRQAIVQGALALWRTKGFADTTVTDICKAAGVSKALFYVYFSRKEDVLLELEVFTKHDALVASREALTGPYELLDVIAAIIDTLVRQARPNPPELIFEAVLETYRFERLALANGATEADLAALFLEPFEQAQRDGRIPDGVDLVRGARISQIMVADGIRHWAADGCRDDRFAETLSKEITALLHGLWTRR